MCSCSALRDTGSVCCSVLSSLGRGSSLCVCQMTAVHLGPMSTVPAGKDPYLIKKLVTFLEVSQDIPSPSSWLELGLISLSENKIVLVYRDTNFISFAHTQERPCLLAFNTVLNSLHFLFYFLVLVFSPCFHPDLVFLSINPPFPWNPVFQAEKW